MIDLRTYLWLGQRVNDVEYSDHGDWVVASTSGPFSASVVCNASDGAVGLLFGEYTSIACSQSSRSVLGLDYKGSVWLHSLPEGKRELIADLRGRQVGLHSRILWLGERWGWAVVASRGSELTVTRLSEDGRRVVSSADYPGKGGTTGGLDPGSGMLVLCHWTGAGITAVDIAGRGRTFEVLFEGGDPLDWGVCVGAGHAWIVSKGGRVAVVNLETREVRQERWDGVGQFIKLSMSQERGRIAVVSELGVKDGVSECAVGIREVGPGGATSLVSEFALSTPGVVQGMKLHPTQDELLLAGKRLWVCRWPSESNR